jgi:hypothetical protein
MAGNVDQIGAVGDDLDALAHHPLMMLPTAFSLPGMVREEKIMQSPFFSVTCGWSLLAILASAARGVE